LEVWHVTPDKVLEMPVKLRKKFIRKKEELSKKK